MNLGSWVKINGNLELHIIKHPTDSMITVAEGRLVSVLSTQAHHYVDHHQLTSVTDARTTLTQRCLMVQRYYIFPSGSVLGPRRTSTRYRCIIDDMLPLSVTIVTPSEHLPQVFLTVTKAPPYRQNYTRLLIWVGKSPYNRAPATVRRPWSFVL